LLLDELSHGGVFSETTDVNDMINDKHVTGILGCLLQVCYLSWGLGDATTHCCIVLAILLA
jgi:hypothetical protein